VKQSRLAVQLAACLGLLTAGPLSAQQPKLLATLKGHTGYVSAVAFNRAGTLLASGSHDTTVKVWDLATGKERATFEEGHGKDVGCLAFSPDGRLLASGGGSGDGRVKLWDLRRREGKGPIRGRHKGSVFSVAFSGDGRLLASGSEDETVKLWDVQTGRERATLKGHRDMVFPVAFRGDGGLLAAASIDGPDDGFRVKLWDVASGKERATFNGLGNYVLCVAFGGDGRLLAAGCDDKDVKVWELPVAGD
jgi:WD40 repeat protein